MSWNLFRRARTPRRLPLPRRCPPRCEPLGDRLAPATFTVTNTDDSGPGSLRQAILNANQSSATDRIEFDIPGSGVHTIAPASALPTIFSPVEIDGYTQPGSRRNTAALGTNAVLLIELDGSNCPRSVLTNGLTFNTSQLGGAVQGLVINRFTFGAIALRGGGEVVLRGNFLGTDPSGTLPRGNDTGILLDSFDNIVGGTDVADRNLISANGNGIVISSGSSGHAV